MDPDLVRSAQRGDEEAFASLAVAAGDRLHAVAHRILRDTDLAEDATQQALLSIWRDLPQLRDPARFDAWSYRLLVRACYAEGRRDPPLDAEPPPPAGRRAGRPGGPGLGRRSRPARARLPAAVHRPSRGGGAAPLPRPAARRGRRHARRPRRDGPIPSTSRDARPARGPRGRRPTDAAGGRPMSTDRDVTRIVRSWLEEGATALPDRVLDAVLDQSPRPHSAGPVAGVEVLQDATSSCGRCAAGAVVVAVAVVGLGLLSQGGGIGTPAPTPTPTSPPTPSPSPSRRPHRPRPQAPG